MTTDFASGARHDDGDRRFRSIFDSAAIGIAVIDMRSGTLLESNGALREMLGYTAEELCGKSFADITYPPDLDSDLALFGEMVAGTRDRYSIEKRYVRKNGALVWAKLHASVDRSVDGSPTI